MLTDELEGCKLKNWIDEEENIKVHKLKVYIRWRSQPSIKLGISGAIYNKTTSRDPLQVVVVLDFIYESVRLKVLQTWLSLHF